MEREPAMILRNLAEGIILQSIEDLWNDEHKEESLVFFRGKDFRTCAALAGMSLGEQVELINMVKGVIIHKKNDSPSAKRLFGKVEKRMSGYVRETAVTLH
jgi:hypothetical protein